MAKSAVRKTAKKPVKKAAKRPTKKAAKKPARRPAKKTVRRAAPKPVRKVARKAVPKKKPVRKVARKAVPKKKPVRKVARKVVPKKKPVRKVARKVVPKKKPERKAARKVVPKKKPERKAARKVVPKKKPERKVARKAVPKKKPERKVARKAVPKKKPERRVARKAVPEKQTARKPVQPPRSFQPGVVHPPPARPGPGVGVSGAPGVVKRSAPERRVLVLGAGLVARPLVQYLLRQPGYHVTVASRTVSKAEDLVGGAPNGEALSYDITDPTQLEAMVGRADLAVSLLPYVHHPVVARACIRRRKHMVTTSYVSDAMRALDSDARAAGIVLLNEMGLDPGIDHMSAMRIIHKVQREGGSIVHFFSNCGGLPAPEANTNPLGYKFSWSPRGVLMAGRNSARFRKDGQTVEIPGPKLFENYWESKLDEHGTFEVYPNRDSLAYLPIYGIQSSRTCLRGTFRNVGWCRFMKKAVDLGLLDDAPRTDLAGMNLVGFTRSLVGTGAAADVRVAVAQKLDLPPDSEVVLKLEWLGLFSQDPVPVKAGGNIDVLTALMNARMQYGRGERDMIVLRHEFIAEFPGGRREEITSTLIDFGVPGGDSAMSRTVALPAAIAGRLILEGRIDRQGVCIPVEPAIFHPVLDELSTQGIHCVEKATVR